MTARKTKATAPARPAGGSKPLVIHVEAGETEAQTMSRAMLAPFLRHGIVAKGLADRMLGDLPGEPNFDDYGFAIKASADQAGQGDLTIASAMLTAQALSLDAIFTEMARRSALNMGEYLEASERYMRLALKAQANSRATIEALAKLHSPREQTVRHVHVNEGGQAVIADTFHHHAGGGENGQTGGQPHATGTGAAGGGPTVPGPDPFGEAVPLPGGEREPAVPDARRQG